MTTNWKKNRLAAQYRDDSPTMTDQAAARDTDINVIVGQFLIHGQAPAGGTEPTYGDFTELPTDLRGFLELARGLEDRRRELPEQLRQMELEELLALTPEQLTNKLTPPATPPANPEEPKT